MLIACSILSTAFALMLLVAGQTEDANQIAPLSVP